MLKHRLLSIKAMDNFNTGWRKHREEQVNSGEIGEPELTSVSKAEASHHKCGEERTEVSRRKIMKKLR